MNREEKIAFILSALEDPEKLRIIVRALFQKALPNAAEEDMDKIILILTNGQT